MAPKDPVHVLVVDDDRNVQRMLADALTRAGFQVTVERDGESALAAFDRQPFDVVLLDVLLPALNGYEVARRIKSTPRGERTPVLMLSGIYKTKMHQAQAVERHGAAGFVEKPFKLNQLFGKLEGLLGDRFPKPPPAPPREAPPEPASEPLADSRAEAEASLVEVTAAESTAAEPAPGAAGTGAAPASPPAVDRGTFAGRAFPELLADLHRRGATGGLLLRRDKVKKIVFFRGGAPESVKSNRLSECLGRVMVRERMISEADCEESLKRMKTSGRQQGTVLIEMGCISPHNLRYALELQLRLKLLEVFGWSKGDFQFNPRAQPPSETVRLQMSTAAIVHEGIKRSYDVPRIQTALGEIAGKYVHPAEDPLFAAQDMSLGEEEAGLLALMDGSRTVRELRKRGPLSPLDTDRFLYALLCSQMVELRSVRRTGPPPAVRAAALTPGPGDRPWDDDEEVLELEDEVAGDDDEGHLRERLLGALAAMRRMNYFELLGLRHDAPPDAVRLATVELLREYRVDGPGSSAEVETVVHQIAELVGKAHDALVDPGSRARYEAELRTGGVKHEVGEAVGRMLEAESAFRRGEQLLAAGDVPGAHAAFTEAVRLQPEEGEFLTLLGWTTHARSPSDAGAGRQALSILTEAVDRSPTLDRAHLYKGHVHKALGQNGEAQGEYEKAVECNPGCTEALRELSILTWAARRAHSRPS